MAGVPPDRKATGLAATNRAGFAKGRCAAAINYQILECSRPGSGSIEATGNDHLR